MSKEAEEFFRQKTIENAKTPRMKKFLALVNREAEGKILQEYADQQLRLYGVVFNEAKTTEKQTQRKLIEYIMKADEELSLYSEVELVCDRINDNNANICITCGVKAGHPCGLQTN